MDLRWDSWIISFVFFITPYSISISYHKCFFFTRGFEKSSQFAKNKLLHQLAQFSSFLYPHTLPIISLFHMAGTGGSVPPI